MKRLTLTTAALVLFLCTSGLFAQNERILNLKPEFLQNLEMAVMSENHGLSKSAIYLTGKYKISSLVDVLVEKISTEQDESIRLLVALTLNEIGTPESMAVVNVMSTEDPDNRVKKFCRLIMDEYLDSHKLVDVEY
jgi:hypothetical protein